MTDENIFDQVKLECSDEYAKYISKMLHAFKMLQNVYILKKKRDKEASEESKVLLFYFKKLLYTFEVLRYKYLFNPVDSLKIDKGHSGFVNFSEIMGIEKDIPFRKEKLESFASAYELRQKIANHLLRYAQQPKKDLEYISQRTYFEKLDEQKLFLFFNPGELELLDSDDSRGIIHIDSEDPVKDTDADSQEKSKCRRYSYHWACFDKKTNMPYIYLIVFDQDEDSEPLENDGENAQRFYDVIKSEGSRAPAAGIVAMAIDQRLDDIHPKFFKRICVGPMHSLSFSENLDEPVQNLLAAGDEGEQFVFHIVEQFVFSDGSKVVSDKGMLSNLLGGKKVREKFYVPRPTNVDEYSKFNELDEQKASLIRKRVLMSHTIHQHAESHFGDSRLISYNSIGKINGI